MRGHIVDTLLAKLDGEIAPIWVTLGLEIENVPPLEEWIRALKILMENSPRLHLKWCSRSESWETVRRSEEAIEKIMTWETAAMSPSEALEKMIVRPINLEQDIPFRLHISPCGGRKMFIMQLHHAFGDARALGRLLDFLWQCFQGIPKDAGNQTLILVKDSQLWFRFFCHPWATLGILRAKNRLVTRRALSLRKDGQEIAQPIVQTTHFSLNSSYSSADLFYSAILATMLKFTEKEKGILRFRMPFDLSKIFGWKNSLANTCIALPVEFPLEEARSLEKSPSQLIGYVKKQIFAVVAKGGYWPALLECLIAARWIPTSQIRAGARPGLLEEMRTNTMVVTYVGNLDRYFSKAPFEIHKAYGHTPTWGANAFTLRGELVVNVSCFAGIWTKETLAQFSQTLAKWIEDNA